MGGSACKEKIILNGDTIEGIANSLCSRVLALGTVELTEAQGYEIIGHLNKAEDEMFKAQLAWLKSQGYNDGPLPHSMS